MAGTSQTRAPEARLLVVDDEPSVHEILTEFFTSKGYEVISASGGLEGLSKTEKHRPDVILLDVRMPGIDGIEVANRLSAEDSTRVLVLATSADLPEFSPLARSCGAAALVQKRWLTPRLLRGLWIAHRRR